MDKQIEFVNELVKELAGEIGEKLADEILSANQSDEAGIQAQRNRVADLKQKLSGSTDPRIKQLLSLADMLVKKSVWMRGWGWLGV